MYNALLSIPVLALAAGAAAVGVSVTPHDKYSSSVGVLGCKIDTNRVAYWPGSVDCNNICVKLTYGSRSVHLLRIDQSQGAHDISYDAYVYLQTGHSAVSDPITGGGVAMEYEEVDASECADLIYTEGSKLPLSAANSINFLASCLAQPSSWVAQNYVLYNICDAICTLGYDEVCTLDLATSNQPTCPHTLGLTSKLTSTPVYDISYQSGKIVMAGTGEAAPSGAQIPVSPEESSPAASVATSASASAAATPAGGVFIENSASSAPASTAALVASSSVVTSTVQSTAAAISSQATQAPTTVAKPTSSSFYNGTVTSTVKSCGASGCTTLSVVTLSSSPSSATSSSGVTATTVPVNGGQAQSFGSVLALVSGIVLCSILNII